MTKGFITLATGNERYFKLASNLLKSYRFFSKNPLPFAIIADHHNKYTDEFDEVIILEDAKSSYMDKLSILINCPFDETIFIDADCLAYQDLNEYWDFYDFSYSLTCFGVSNSLNFKNGWFKKEDVGKYGDQISFIPSMHGGCYFIKRSHECQKIYDLAMEINTKYYQYKFKYFDDPADEPILALCMAVFNCHPIEMKTINPIVFYPAVTNFESNINFGINSYTAKNKTIKNSYLVHWQNYFTTRALYKTEVDRLNFLYENNLGTFSKLKSVFKIKTRSLLYGGSDFLKLFKTFIKKETKKLVRI